MDESGPSTSKSQGNKWQQKYLTQNELEEIMKKFVEESDQETEDNSDSEEDGLIEPFDTDEDIDNVNESSVEETVDIEEEDYGEGTEIEIRGRDSDEMVSVVSVPARLYGKNKFKWSGIRPTSRTRRAAKNIVVHLPGNRGEARYVKSGLDAFNLFFTDDIMKQIQEYTNKEIDRQRSQYKSDRERAEDETEFATTTVRPTFTKHTTITELRALFGIYIMTGVLNMNHVTVKELFDRYSGVCYFRATMPQARFEFLTNCLRFDDRSTREERRIVDRLAPIRTLFDHIVQRSQDLYVPSEYCTVDEQLLAFRGRCPFKTYIPSKPDKYGIKILMMCDAKTFYMINAKVYTGKGATPSGIPVAEYYSVEMTKPIHGTNRNCTFDNWFTSIPMAKKLLNEHQVTIVGTMRVNKAELPLSFTNKKDRKRNTAMFAFSEDLVLLSYCPPKSKTKKIVILLSSMHDVADEDKTVQLPEIIQFYNSTKGGVDSIDKLCHQYSVSRKTRRWPLCMLYGLLNIVGVNTLVLLNGSEAKDKERVSNRRLYLKKLALSLMQPYMRERLTWPTLPVYLRENIKGILKESGPDETQEEKQTNSGRCSFCARSRDRKSRTRCNKCKKFICADHQIKVCPGCSEKQ